MNSSNQALAILFRMYCFVPDEDPLGCQHDMGPRSAFIPRAQQILWDAEPEVAADGAPSDAPLQMTRNQFVFLMHDCYFHVATKQHSGDEDATKQATTVVNVLATNAHSLPSTLDHACYLRELQRFSSLIYPTCVDEEEARAKVMQDLTTVLLPFLQEDGILFAFPGADRGLPHVSRNLRNDFFTVHANALRRLYFYFCDIVDAHFHARWMDTELVLASSPRMYARDFVAFARHCKLIPWALSEHVVLLVFRTLCASMGSAPRPDNDQSSISATSGGPESGLLVNYICFPVFLEGIVRLSLVVKQSQEGMAADGGAARCHWLCCYLERQFERLFGFTMSRDDEVMQAFILRAGKDVASVLESELQVLWKSAGELGLLRAGDVSLAEEHESSALDSSSVLLERLLGARRANELRRNPHLRKFFFVYSVPDVTSKDSEVLMDSSGWIQWGLDYGMCPSRTLWMRFWDEHCTQAGRDLMDLDAFILALIHVAQVFPAFFKSSLTNYNAPTTSSNMAGVTKDDRHPNPAPNDSASTPHVRSSMNAPGTPRIINLQKTPQAKSPQKPTSPGGSENHSPSASASAAPANADARENGAVSSSSAPLRRFAELDVFITRFSSQEFASRLEHTLEIRFAKSKVPASPRVLRKPPAPPQKTSDGLPNVSPSKRRPSSSSSSSSSGLVGSSRPSSASVSASGAPLSAKSRSFLDFELATTPRRDVRCFDIFRGHMVVASMLDRPGPLVPYGFTGTLKNAAELCCSVIVRSMHLNKMICELAHQCESFDQLVGRFLDERFDLFYGDKNNFDVTRILTFSFSAMGRATTVPLRDPAFARVWRIFSADGRLLAAARDVAGVASCLSWQPSEGFLSNPALSLTMYCREESQLFPAVWQGFMQNAGFVEFRQFLAVYGIWMDPCMTFT